MTISKLIAEGARLIEGLGDDIEDTTHKVSLGLTGGMVKAGHVVNKVVPGVGDAISHVGNFAKAGMEAGRGVVLKRRGDAAGAQAQFQKAKEAGKESLKDVGRGAASLLLKKQ